MTFGGALRGGRGQGLQGRVTRLGLAREMMALCRSTARLAGLMVMVVACSHAVLRHRLLDRSDATSDVMSLRVGFRRFTEEKPAWGVLARLSIPPRLLLVATSAPRRVNSLRQGSSSRLCCLPKGFFAVLPLRVVARRIGIGLGGLLSVSVCVC